MSDVYVIFSSKDSGDVSLTDTGNAFTCGLISDEEFQNILVSEGEVLTGWFVHRYAQHCDITFVKEIRDVKEIKTMLSIFGKRFVVGHDLLEIVTQNYDE